MIHSTQTEYREPGTSVSGRLGPVRRLRLAAAASVVALGLTACQSNTQIEKAIDLNPDQGSQENIASLTAVVERNPKNAEAYNVRGTAFGKAGRNCEALADFTRAIAMKDRAKVPIRRRIQENMAC